MAENNHSYLSTACLHGKHELCRLRCKYCNSLCTCAVCKHSVQPSEEGDDVLTSGDWWYELR